MPDFPLPDDEAALYVIGGLTVAERRDFESRLAESAELRALVRELEEGAVALAMTSPVRQPPQKVWKEIERTVAKETKRGRVIPAVWSALWRSGWAAAAVCLAGWILYALLVRPPISKKLSSSEIHPPREARVTESQTQPGNIGLNQSLAETNAMRQLLELRALEIGALRQHLTGLENRVASLSHSLTQQQSLLRESNRLKCFQLVPTTNPNAASDKAILSPALQHAVFLAMARELGWAPPVNPASEVNGNAAWDTTSTNRAGVDFVDFRPATNAVTTPPESQPKAETETAEVREPFPTNAIAASSVIPAFVSGENLVVAIDSSITTSDGQVAFSTGSQLTFWNGNGVLMPLGSTVLGNNPLVVTLPASAFSANGGNGATLIIGTTSPAGQSSTFYFSMPVTPNP